MSFAATWMDLETIIQSKSDREIQVSYDIASRVFFISDIALFIFGWVFFIFSSSLLNDLCLDQFSSLIQLAFLLPMF